MPVNSSELVQLLLPLLQLLLELLLSLGELLHAVPELAQGRRLLLQPPLEALLGLGGLLALPPGQLLALLQPLEPGRRSDVRDSRLTASGVT